MVVGLLYTLHWFEVVVLQTLLLELVMLLQLKELLVAVEVVITVGWEACLLSVVSSVPRQATAHEQAEAAHSLALEVVEAEEDVPQAILVYIKLFAVSFQQL